MRVDAEEGERRRLPATVVEYDGEEGLCRRKQ